MNNPILEQIDLPIFDQIKQNISIQDYNNASMKIKQIKEIENYDISKIDYKFLDELVLDYKLSNAWSQIYI